MESPEAVKGIKNGDKVSVDFSKGVITNETTGEKFTSEPFPPFIQEMVAKDGLINYLKEEVLA